MDYSPDVFFVIDGVLFRRHEFLNSFHSDPKDNGMPFNSVYISFDRVNGQVDVSTMIVRAQKNGVLIARCLVDFSSHLSLKGDSGRILFEGAMHIISSSLSGLGTSAGFTDIDFSASFSVNH